MNYALIGCGRIAVNHLQAALDNHFTISAVCDMSPEAMEAEKNGREKSKKLQSERQTLSDHYHSYWELVGNGLANY